MHTINNPMQIPELDLKPELQGGVNLSEDMQQVLALLAGYWQNKRVLLKATPSGMLCVTSPQVKDIYYITANADNYAYQGENIECSEVMVIAHPNNTGRIWVKAHALALTTNSIPLDKKESFSFTITNLNMLNLLIATDTEKAIVIYTQ
jgi:hypothetical protein